MTGLCRRLVTGGLGPAHGPEGVFHRDQDRDLHVFERAAGVRCHGDRFHRLVVGKIDDDCCLVFAKAEVESLNLAPQTVDQRLECGATILGVLDQPRHRFAGIGHLRQETGHCRFPVSDAFSGLELIEWVSCPRSESIPTVLKAGKEPGRYVGGPATAVGLPSVKRALPRLMAAEKANLTEARAAGDHGLSASV